MLKDISSMEDGMLAITKKSNLQLYLHHMHSYHRLIGWVYNQDKGPKD